MKQNEAIETLNDIRDIMERSTKFLSLSGVSAILVGVYACAGVLVAARILGQPDTYHVRPDHVNTLRPLFAVSLTALAVLAASLATVFALSYRKCKRAGEGPLVTPATRRLLWNFFLPLVAGGLFCASLLVHGHYGLTSSVMLLFYGLALVNASKYTYSNTRYLGYAEILLRLADSFAADYALLFWGVGFGLFHIIYGVFFHLRIEHRPGQPAKRPRP